MYKIDHKISAKLREYLLDNCPVIKEAEERIKQALLESAIPDMAEEATVTPTIFAFRELGDIDGPEPKPKFKLGCFDYYHPGFHSKHVNYQNYEKSKTIAHNVLLKMQKEHKYPVEIQPPNEVILIKDLPDTAKFYCFQEEADAMRQAAVKPFDEAETISYE